MANELRERRKNTVQKGQQKFKDHACLSVLDAPSVAFEGLEKAWVFGKVNAEFNIVEKKELENSQC